MAVRKALAYSKRYARPYTRVSRAKSKAYIKVVPNNKVVKYSVGNVKAYNEGKFPFVLHLNSKESAQVRDLAIEAARQLLTKNLDLTLPGAYYLEVKVHPHHLLRNNKTAAGAGADRMSSGMSRSFGEIEGRAAFVNAGKDIFVIHCADENGVKKVRSVLEMAKSKLPCSTSILFEKR